MDIMTSDPPLIAIINNIVMDLVIVRCKFSGLSSSL